ncbi:MAG TPA: helix-turn-helix transcriptional regulator [Micromonosporaceae bacterium]|jgi:transcriptional regulator with XRE-family HTH domain
MVLLRRMIGDVLRRHRTRQSRTLRDVSVAAGVSLGYLSEVERGRKEASSELLAAICGALDVSLAEVLREVSDDLAREERRRRFAPVGFTGTPGGIIPPTRSARRPVAGIAPLRPGQRPNPRPTTPVGTVAVPKATLGSTNSPFPVVAA